MAPLIRGGSLRIAGGALALQIKVKHDLFYAFIGRPRANTLGIGSIDVNSLFWSLLLMLYGFWGFHTLLHLHDLLFSF